MFETTVFSYSVTKLQMHVLIVMFYAWIESAGVSVLIMSVEVKCIRLLDVLKTAHLVLTLKTVIFSSLLSFQDHHHKFLEPGIPTKLVI